MSSLNSLGSSSANSSKSRRILEECDELMIPVELRLTNFMSYKYMPEPLSFSNIHTACLSGPNGHGKSALLDAITWCLWGRARGVDRRGLGVDDLIHLHEDRMQVEFTFELENQRYRVIRSRARAGRGSTRLEFHILDAPTSSGRTWRSLTADTIHETQEKIDNILRMDYETFVNSAFILQGKVDSFTTKNPNQRKEILADILGLSFYDELEERAKERKREREKDVQISNAQIQRIDEELAKEDEYKRGIESLTRKLGCLQDDIAVKEGNLGHLREQKVKLESKISQLKELKMRMSSTQKGLETIETQIQRCRTEIERAQELIADAEHIREGHRELKDKRVLEEKLAEKARRQNEILSVMREKEKTYVQSRSALETKIENLKRKETELSLDASGIKALEQKLKKIEEELALLQEKEERLETLREDFLNFQRRKSQLTSENETLKEKLKTTEEKIELMESQPEACLPYGRHGLPKPGHGRRAMCPLCKKELTDAERENLLDQFKEELKQCLISLKDNTSTLEQIEERLEVLEEEGKTIKKDLAVKEAILNARTETCMQLQKAKKAEEALKTCALERENLQRQLDTGEFAQEALAKLKEFKTELKKLNYNPDEHRDLREKIKELLPYEQRVFELDNALAKIESFKETLYTFESQKQEKIEILKGDREKETRLLEETSQLPELERQIMFGEKELEELKKAEREFSNRIAINQEFLKNCENKLVEKGELVKERDQILSEIAIYSDLATAFGKKGIQALIIENAIPEIEDEANKLLHKLTNGRFNVRFRTQRNQKTGGVIETLDLIISDGELGDRKYELFSGGEAFRINFAIRIALSKLLAKRAGAKLETLVIDEGFGTQDDEGRDRLVEAISTIKDDFKKIIVVTHLEDLREMFPNRIEITKKLGLGSIAKVI
ncbi:MAG: SMC family ATPase [Actinomycetota bacterium]